MCWQQMWKTPHHCCKAFISKENLSYVCLSIHALFQLHYTVDIGSENVYCHAVHKNFVSKCFNVCISINTSCANAGVCSVSAVLLGLTWVWIGGSVMAAFLLLTVDALCSSCAFVPLHPLFLSSLLFPSPLRAGLQMSGFPKVSSCLYMFALCFSCLLPLLI